MSGRKRKKSKTRGEVYQKYQPPSFKPYVPTSVYRRDSGFDLCASRSTDNGTAPRRETPRYTGTLVTGIATMHKSNAVPVINQQEATDIAHMRR